MKRPQIVGTNDASFGTKNSRRATTRQRKMDGNLVITYGTRMTLATAILLIGICSTGLSAQERVAPSQSTQQSEPSSSSNPQAGQEQDSKTPPAAVPETKPSSSAAQQSTIPPKGHAPKKHVSKKTSSATTCDTGSATSGSTSSAAAAVAPASGVPGNPDASQTQTSVTAPAKNCPPEKIVVRQGGTADPSIQLAGADQASDRADANQMLGSTEANLKKIAGLQLDATQRDTVSQIHQFVDQSKAALAAGDVGRGKTLASKAQMLSEDLVPQKQ